MGVCASRLSADEADLMQLPDVYNKYKHRQPDQQPIKLVHPQQQQQQRPQQQQQHVPQPAVLLAAEHLLDDTLGEVLSQLPLNHLVQLACCSKRLQRMVCQSDKVLKAVDLRPLQAHQLEPALQFLAHHPAADAIHTAVLPSNCHSSGTALAALSGLQALQLYYARLSPPLQQLQHSGTKAGKAVTKGAAAAALAGPAPELTDLPLQQLSGLTSLTLTLESGDIPSGRKLALPGHLQSMSMSAPALGMAINPLELQSLTALSSLKLSVLDASSSKCLAKLLGLPGLAHLSIGRFWCIPDVLHSMSGLSSLEVALYGHVAQHAALDGLEAALTAAGSGLGNLPARPNLQLQVRVAVLSASDGVASDWSCLANLRSLDLHNLYPISGRGFSLQPLGSLARLTALQLGFEGQAQLQGQQHDLELVGLNAVLHLRSLSVTCTGACLQLILEPPLHLTELLVACHGSLQLVAPGHAAKAAAAVAAAAAAASAHSSYVAAKPYLLDTPPAAVICSSPSSSPTGSFCATTSSTGSAAATQNGYSSGSATGSSTANGSSAAHSLAPAASWPLTASGAAFGALAASHSVNLGMLDEQLHGHGHDGGRSGRNAAAAAAAADAAAAVLMMQRHLDRLGSIEEFGEAYNMEDEAEQLAHIARLGLLAGRGITIKDIGAATAGAVEPAAAPGRFDGSSRDSISRMSGVGRSLSSRLMSTLSFSKQEQLLPAVLPLDGWLLAKRLSLEELRLVQRLLPAPQTAAAAAATVDHSCGRKQGGKHWTGSHKAGRPSIDQGAAAGAGVGGCYVLLSRQAMEDELLLTFHEWGFL